MKKSCHHICKGSITDYMSFINNNLDKYTVKQMCKDLKFTRSMYYESLVCLPYNKEQEYLKFSAEVRRCFVVVKKYNHNSNKGKTPDNKENILNRNFKAETMNQK